MAHLMRTWYSTDADETDPEYMGAFSADIPEKWTDLDGWKIIAVDWSKRGEVEVTWLIPGPR